MFFRRQKLSFFSLTVIDDNIEEAALESLELELFGLPSDVKSENDFVSFYIDDNDGVNQPPTGTISFSQATLSMSEADGTLNITLIRENGSIGQRVVEVYATVESASFDDFEFNDQAVVFEEDEAQKTVALTIVYDERVEDTETFKLALLSGSEDALGSNTELQVQISDDDEPPAPPGTVSFGRSTIDVNENAGNLQISLLREGGSNGVLNININASNISAADSDYTLSNETIRFEDGEQEKVMNVAITDDSLDEDTEQFSLSISSSNQADIGATDTITVNIVDNDEAASTGGDSGSNSGNGGNGNASSDSGGGSGGFLLLLLLPFVVVRLVRHVDHF